MGPPLFSGGNEVLDPVMVIARRPSMGPPLFSGGNPHLALQLLRELQPFNGAAAVQRRKSRMRFTDYSTPSFLQWGRRCSAAEIRRRAPQRADGGQAFNGAAAVQRRKCAREAGLLTPEARPSMGPPLFSGGNHEPVSANPHCFGPFNGAAAVQRRKSHSCPHVETRAEHPSMGPPLFSGGNCRPR